MSLDTVVEDIRDEAHARAEDIRDEGEARAEEIESAAEADAEEIRESAETEADREIEQLREQRLSSAKLEAKQKRLEARRDVLGDVREEVEGELTALEGDTREELTRALLDAASTEFDEDNDVSVYGRADDQDLIESILDDYDGYEFAGEYDCLGGVVVESEQSRVRVNNTFDSVLEDVWEDNLREISNQLFEQ
ncbi:A-type ATP synthase subunit E [Natrialba magadii ATCC 43099]|uniref:A-type ATP synthase subunit E n=1 Tax=Natrialba magadii (strain ATCC 43099 / DSM 3394 / CCM 3739 / CIP 104546 / IAM 13178 / JCM 8861 / NBRC 102185 / NCIMB 2190 / MS3) TaxID=547559 RepID=D3ST07_NATMM|nr:V-type ATP synthase subunit E [Natrialba magadii]ADD04953.1 A-type ATP synthase subunit E [Natrialba magadii ATCC 43099]ELY24001.1 V-type ATP synthase subunit E [Natrialba magadii ATCC 43099]